MPADIALRREDKDHWERRAPLTPEHVEELVGERSRSVVVQPSPVRIYPDDAYAAAGAAVAEDLAGSRLMVGVKEIPPAKLLPATPHLAFFHVIKGQPQNMPTLARALEVGATLIDYEKIVDADGRRLLFFGLHAGHAGAIDALWALARRLLSEGIGTPFAEVRPAHAYRSLEAALEHLGERVGRALRERGVPHALRPLVVGLTGGGNVCRGAQEILDRLPVVEIRPDELAGLADDPDVSRRCLYKVVFRRRHRKDFARHLPHLTVLVNGIYWEPGHPRLVTRDDVRRLWAGGPPRLRVVADLSCDVEGSIEVTTRTTSPGDPVYVVDPETFETRSGVEGRGPVVLAIENLPAELPRDASEHFGDSLFPFLAELLDADLGRPFADLALPAPLKGAILAHAGELAPAYEYLRAPLAETVL